MRSKLPGVLFIVAIIIIAKFEAKTARNTWDSALQQQAELAALNIDAKLTSNSNQAGKITAVASGYQLSEQQINRVIEDETQGFSQKSARLLAWPDHSGTFLSLSAIGLDWQHHFASSFLVGVRPFAVENKWLPLFTIAQRKRYLEDEKQYQALDMWQNSAQAYILPDGDCEDHALLLADWLISEGVDARVVGGKYKESGHAWVVAIVDGQSFLLEATDKRAGKSWNAYPLAALAKHYFPMYMFNRTTFWENMDATNVSDYTHTSWVERAHFSRD